AFLSIIIILLLGGFVWGIQVITTNGGNARWIILPLASLLALILASRLYRKYYRGQLQTVNTTFAQWYWLFFLAFITHILLDSFTAYGTQVFQPFSNFRLAFNNISIVDPLYTIPFLTCLIIAST